MTSKSHTTASAGADRESLEATERALSAAHDAHLREAMRQVRWERRGLLGRLVRRPGVSA
jgi:hypothetical protein